MRRKPNSRRKARRMKVIRLWNYLDAVRALPYLRSVVNSARDNWLDVQNRKLVVRRLTELKPTRENLIDMAEARRELDRAESQLRDTLRELRRIHVFILDPVEGLALIPFQRGEDLAWFVSDLFAERGIVAWRWHTDELGHRRPIEEVAGILAMTKKA